MFGDIFLQKKKLLRRLARIQKALDRNSNQFLWDSKRDLQSQLNSITIKEEKFWHQKSKNPWLKAEDKNTKFFHLSTIIRRRNKLEGMMLRPEGVWKIGKEDMKEVAVKYFKDLFTEPNQAGLPYYWPNLFPTLDGITLVSLHMDVTQDEIKQALFAIGSLKALGPDGFLAHFFQKCWDIYKNDICAMVHSIF